MNFVGFLEDGGISPEKSLNQVRTEHLLKYFEVNSIVSVILAKLFFNLFRHEEPSCFAVLSAKVGSISDNQLGGWYGYRASKAALNMFIKNISLEFRMRRCHCLVLALHPGTTRTDLSKKHLSQVKHRIHSASETAINLLGQIEGRRIEESGSFLSWDGKEIPW